MSRSDYNAPPLFRHPLIPERGDTLDIGLSGKRFRNLTLSGTATLPTAAITTLSGTVTFTKLTTSGTGTYSGVTLSNGEFVGVASGGAVGLYSSGTVGWISLQAGTTMAHTSAGIPFGNVSQSFVPPSGSGSFSAFQVNPTINGTSSGTAYGISVASKTNTLTGGNIKLLSLGTTTTDSFTGYTPLWEVDVTGATTLGGTKAAATTATTIVKKVTGIADNSATDVFTVTVPNANHACAVRLTLLSSNGSTDAFESSRVATGTVVLARTTGANVVAAVSAIAQGQIATVSGGATHTLAYGVSAISGAVGATNTFTITVTIDDSGNLGSNQVVAVAELINSEATGVTIA